MWAAMMTRPEIANVVHSTAKYCENPGVVHKKAIEKILKYMLRNAN